MKKFVVFVATLISCAVIVSVAVSKQHKDNINVLLLQNVEALANDGEYDPPLRGEIDCLKMEDNKCKIYFKDWNGDLFEAYLFNLIKSN